MMGRVMRFEGRRWLRSWAFYLLFSLFASLGMLVMALLTGAIDRLRIVLVFGGETLYMNSPYMLHIMISTLSLLGTIAVAGIVGAAVHQDHAQRVEPMLWSTPMRPWQHWWGRTTAAFGVSLLALLGVAFGAWLSTLMPWGDPNLVGPNELRAYLAPYGFVVLPRVLLVGGLAALLASRTGSLLPGYLVSLLMIAGSQVTAGMLRDLDNRELAALLDPSGGTAWSLITENWTTLQKNTLIAPLEGTFLTNRLIWTGLAVGILLLGVWLHRPDRFAEGGRGPVARWSRRLLAPVGGVLARLGTLPRAWLRALVRRQPLVLRQIHQEYRSVVTHPLFCVVLPVGLLSLWGASHSVTQMFGTTTWPVTYSVLMVMEGVFALFALGLVVFFSGYLIHREERHRVEGVMDALPVSTWRPLLVKLIAMVGVVATLQGVLLAAGVLFQWREGYTRFELPVYFESLFGFQLTDLILLLVLTFCVQSVMRQEALAYLASFLLYFAVQNSGAIGLDHVLYRYAADPGRTYSELNAFRPFLPGWFTVKAYWIALGLVLLLACGAFWRRGMDEGWRHRWRRARHRLDGWPRRLATLAAVGALGLAGWILFNTHVLNRYTTAYAAERQQVEIETRWRRDLALPAPRIAAVELAVDLYPEQRDARVAGSFQLENRAGLPQEEFVLRLSPRVTVKDLVFEPAADLLEEDPDSGYRRYRWHQPWPEGGRGSLRFDLEVRKDGFANSEGGLGVLPNGTFLHSSMLPTFGYDPGAEIVDPRRRRKFGLEPRRPLPPADDAWGRAHNVISVDADWLDFEVVVSTERDQVALAPGDLVEEWRQGGRRYFHFRAARPILNMFAFVSGDYTVTRDEWNGVRLEVYHDPDHAMNVPTMVRGMKKSLAYLSENFGPYPHGTLRIVEFPRYAQFAQSFPAMIPFSEALGFIARLKNPDDIDYPFYITAHEVAHQWWGHKLVSARTEGATMLVETLAQYSALRVMEAQYGKDLMGKFLRYELDRYILGRGVDLQGEVPLVEVQNQSYIHYNKGSLATYGLAEQVGGSVLDALLGEFLERRAYAEPPYPTARDLVDFLKGRVPPDKAPVVEDLFERITLFDLETVEASCTRREDGRYAVTLQVRTAKRYQDAEGNSTDAAMDIPVQVGVLGEKKVLRKTRPTALALESRVLPTGEHTVELVVSKLPRKAGIDPYHHLVDLDPMNNVVPLDCAAGDHDHGGDLVTD